MNRRTADEKFLIQVYLQAKKKGDLFSEQDIAFTLRALGQKELMGKTIVRDLAQCNFIKKGREGKVHLTPQGVAFAERELELES